MTTPALAAAVIAAFALAIRDAHAGGGALFWAALSAALPLSAWLLNRLSALGEGGRGPLDRALALVAPLGLGAVVLALWEVMVVGLGVPMVLLPAPSTIGARLVDSVPVLAQDVVQTFLRAVLPGYAVGCGLGFAAALVADRSAILRRGLLPVASLVSALPVIGVAPIMVMWFGFDWPSKAAVVTLMTFFPMLVGTLSGLAAAGALERDLLRSYAASRGQTLRLLLLPAAMPFVFTALKVNAPLALIGAIVAEFFGSPTVGMGFRITAEAGRLAMDMVWAEVAVAAALGTLFYGAVALAERVATFWHASIRAASRAVARQGRRGG